MALAACATVDTGHPLRIVVDPGNALQDEHDLCVASLEQAVQLVARHDVPAEILLAPCDHAVRRPVVVPRRASSLVVRAMVPGARLVGGIELRQPQWQPVSGAVAQRLDPAVRDRVRELTLSTELLAGWTGGLSGPLHQGHGVPAPATRSELFVGGRAMTLARWPDEGFASIASLVDPGSAPRMAEPDIPAADRVVEPARGGAFTVADPVRAARWAGASDAWAHGYWNWDWSDELLPIASVDPATATVRLAQPHRYGIAARGRFYVTNLPEELDTPGEYWIDPAAGTVLALLPDGAATAPCSLSLLAAPMLVLDGATDVCVEGIEFACSRAGALAGRDAHRVVVAHCTFRLLGSPAVGLEGSDCSVRACVFEDLGGTGVELAGGNRVELVAGRMVVEDCVFRRCARVLRTYQPAIRVAGVGNVVRHNDVGELPHFALMMHGNEHVVEGNEFHHVVLETGDAGALYLGRDWTLHGNVVRNNLFHSIRGSDSRFQNGVYLDDMASGIAVERNLFVRCNWGVLAGGGRDVRVHENAFVGCGLSVSFDARGVGWMSPHLADPSRSTLHQRLAAVPVANEPWRTRYPTLGGYLTDGFGRPRGSSVSGSVLVASRPPRIEDRESVHETGTVSLDPPADLDSAADRWIAQVRHGTLQLGGLSFGPVGPRVSPGADARASGAVGAD
ncbi:MAG: hypothetical protein RL148_537 [Planctomycetota bacterium]